MQNLANEPIHRVFGNITLPKIRELQESSFKANKNTHRQKRIQSSRFKIRLKGVL